MRHEYMETLIHGDMENWRHRHGNGDMER
jgi:hypothetical protein